MCKLFVQDDLVRLSLDVLGECLFGYKFNSIDVGRTQISQAFNDVTIAPGAVNTLFRRLLYSLPFFKGSVRIQESFKITSKVIKQVKNIKSYSTISMQTSFLLHMKVFR